MSCINLVACFQKVKTEPENYGYTNGYCTGNLLILIFSIITMIYISALLYWTLKENQIKIKTFKKHKTWIFLLMFVFQTIVTIRYFFNLYDTLWYPFLLAFGQCVQSMIIFLVCYFFTVKASVKKGDLYWLKRLLKFSGIGFGTVFLVLGILQYVQFQNTSTEICNTVAYILPTLFNVIITVLFIWAGFVVEKHAKNY